MSGKNQQSLVEIEEDDATYSKITYSQTTCPTYIHAYIHAYTHTYIHTYIHTSIHPYIHTSIHPYIHTSIHTYIHTANGGTVRVHFITPIYIAIFPQPGDHKTDGPFGSRPLLQRPSKTESHAEACLRLIIAKRQTRNKSFKNGRIQGNVQFTGYQP